VRERDLIVLAAGFLALRVNAVGASSDIDAYCDLAEESPLPQGWRCGLEVVVKVTGDTEIDGERLVAT
jgi:hypothetical protein